MMERQYSNVEENLRRIRAEMAEAAVKAGRDPSQVELMAVTKTVPAQVVNRAIAQGITLLGENRSQELNEKYDSYDKDGVSIHFIGHLQSNKVRQVIDKVDMIHSVDSLKLAAEIQRQAEKGNRTIGLLIEVNIGGELSKSGVEPEAVEELIRQIAAMQNVRVKGLMTIPPICDSDLQLDRYFSSMQQLLVDIGAKNIDNVSMEVLSMGMSGDFAAAIRHGATIIRVGSAIFGSRN